MSYEPPGVEDLATAVFRAQVDASFGEVWDALVEFSVSDEFVPVLVERPAGTLVIEFGAREPSRFVTGGFVDIDDDSFETGMHFTGDYAACLFDHRGADLKGRLHVHASAARGGCLVVVSADYVLVWHEHEFSFDTNSSARLVDERYAGEDPRRRIRPTHLAERLVLDAARRADRRGDR